MLNMKLKISSAKKGKINSGKPKNVISCRPKNSVSSGKPMNSVSSGRPMNSVFSGRPMNSVSSGRPMNSVFSGRAKNNVFSSTSKNIVFLLKLQTCVTSQTQNADANTNLNILWKLIICLILINENLKYNELQRELLPVLLYRKLSVLMYIKFLPKILVSEFVLTSV